MYYFWSLAVFHFLGRQLLIKAVNRVWTELIHSKKQVLEELFKVTLPVNERGHVDIAIARPLIEEASLKCWQNHLGKNVYRYHVAKRLTHDYPMWVPFRYEIKTFPKGYYDGSRNENQYSIDHSRMIILYQASLEAQLVKNPPAMRKTWVWSLGWEDPLEKGKATHSSILAWRIPWGCKELDTTEHFHFQNDYTEIKLFFLDFFF